MKTNENDILFDDSVILENYLNASAGSLTPNGDCISYTGAQDENLDCTNNLRLS
jgi:hypothetical protein